MITSVQKTIGSFQRAFALLFLSLIAVAVAFGSGCERTAAQHQSSSRAPSQGQYTIVATTAMIADIVRNVAGDRASVHTLMDGAVDPHLYRATRSDMTAMLNAHVVFYNGLNLEGKMGDTLVKVASSGRPVHAVTELLDEQYLLEPEGFDGHFDPHAWMDPNAWSKATEVVIDKLSEFDPTHSQEYAQRGQKYIAELKRLDVYARKRLATVPQERRVLVTAHDAFNYFARAYEVEVLGIQGISTDSQAGVKQIEDLAALLVARRIPAVFTETSVSDKNVMTLIEAARDRGHEVRLGGELFSDAMGQANTYEGTYIGMIDHNVTTIVRALGGQAPESGLNGKLVAHAEKK
jgi:manganese/zinc/iron transport system substrate-binding protein